MAAALSDVWPLGSTPCVKGRVSQCLLLYDGESWEKQPTSKKVSFFVYNIIIMAEWILVTFCCWLQSFKCKSDVQRSRKPRGGVRWWITPSGQFSFLCGLLLIFSVFLSWSSFPGGSRAVTVFMKRILEKVQRRGKSAYQMLHGLWRQSSIIICFTCAMETSVRMVLCFMHLNSHLFLCSNTLICTWIFGGRSLF